ncbi:MAG: cytochrome c peroxidase [Bacteroidota bacterium]
MKKHLLSALLLGAFTLAFFVGCQKDADLPYKAETLNLPASPLNYAKPEVPGHFTGVLSKFEVTDNGATLGRVLFYDKKLSLNNKIACGSCHLQEKAFADPAAGSVGFEGKITPRNSLAITNPALEKTFFWDLRESDLTDMVLKPIKNHIEMGMEDLDKLSVKLAGAKYYPALFEKAFGSTEITDERIASALTQFLRSMVTCNAKIDKGQPEVVLSAQEKEGMNLFFGKALCSSCHGGRNLNDAFQMLNDTFPPFYGDGRRIANIGLDMNYTDPGLGGREANQEGVFKVPSLRNVALTAPYMHDGRFKTLEEVVEHYNGNIQKHPNLDQRLRDWEGNPWRLNLTTGEKAALVAFLHSFTDAQFTSDERFSDPFAK